MQENSPISIPTFPPYAIQKGSFGVIYIVQDKMEYLDEAIFSAKSVKKWHPDWKITLFINFKSNKSLSVFDQIIDSGIQAHPFKSKVYHIACSPYEYTLFLDTDTQVKGSLSELRSSILEGKFAFAFEPYKSNFEACKKANDFANVNSINTGVLGFQYSEDVYKFLSQWYQSIAIQPDASLNYFNSDQDYFNVLVIKQNLLATLGIPIVVLDNKIYNVRTWIIQSLKEMGVFSNVRLLHHRGLHLTFIQKALRKMASILKR